MGEVLSTQAKHDSRQFFKTRKDSHNEISSVFVKYTFFKARHVRLRETYELMQQQNYDVI